MEHTLTAQQAAARLGVSRQTLYAYVSRGLLRAHGTDDPRQRRYDAEAVSRLAAQRRRGRRPKDVAKATLDWGLPVLESGLTLIRDGQLFYRGQDAVALAETATLEDVAALLWDLPAAFGPVPPPVAMSGAAADDPLLTGFAVQTQDDPTASWQTDPTRLALGCGALVRILAACVTGRRGSAAPVHLDLAQAWTLDAAGADLVRRALVLCADHELNASGFTARCVASTGASLRAAVIGGLAALSGGLHGGMTGRIETLWRGLEPGQTLTGLRAHLTSGQTLPGFGHPLYPDGDIRAAALLARIIPSSPETGAFVSAARDLTGQTPNIDFALVALRRHLRLPEGAAFGLFALGRSAGWIAHALEQRRTGQLIRPRAIYTGPMPVRP